MTANTFEWTGEVMRPLRLKTADESYVIGQRYVLEEVQERSMNSHRFYFASIAESWRNLPEDQAERWPTPEHLRRYALIMCGWRDERTIVAASRAEALRIAAFIKPMDNFAVVTVREAVVRVWTAKSQSMKAMGKTDFQRSKDEVLGFVSEMIGVAPSTLAQEAEKAA